MKKVTPEVILISRPQILWEEMSDYLLTIGGEAWLHRAEGSDAEKLIEFGGRLCYRSFEPGLNANVTRVRDNSYEYLQNIIEVGHGSVTEHAQFSFLLSNLSRVATHEIVRHRVGVGISQESLRYVRLTDIDVWIPEALKFKHDGTVPTLSDGRTIETAVISMVEQLEDLQGEMANALDLDEDGIPFAWKKKATSAMRRIAPIGLATNMLWSANVRTLRHVIEMRTSRHAEEEVRLIYNQIGEIMTNEAPALFDDFTIKEVDGYPEWTTPYGKI